MRHANKVLPGTAQLAAACSILLMGLALATAPARVHAGGSEAKLIVTATILKHASLKVLAQPASVVVTAADIARGYVDVPAPAQLAVRNNSDAFMLSFSGEGDFMQHILVRGLGTDVQLGPAGGFVTQPSPGQGAVTSRLDLGFRFVLSESARQGVYPWPLQMSVSSL